MQLDDFDFSAEEVANGEGLLFASIASTIVQLESMLGGIPAPGIFLDRLHSELEFRIADATPQLTIGAASVARAKYQMLALGVQEFRSSY